MRRKHYLIPAAEEVEDSSSIEELLGRPIQAVYRIDVRGNDGRPVAIRNMPFFYDGTPLPTLYWLVGSPEKEQVSRLESAGGVKRAEYSRPVEDLADAHLKYAALRESLIPEGYMGPRPSGGVGGTRRGVKCLHAHLAWFLAGGDDPVGKWTAEELEIDRDTYWRYSL